MRISDWSAGGCSADLAQMGRAGHAVNNTEDYAAAQKVFRPDVYRAAFAGTNVPLPGASAKLEGGIAETMGVGTVQGRLLLGPDQFFDGRSFDPDQLDRSEEHTSELQSLMRISYAVFCLKTKTTDTEDSE